jgi:hypothetical protein
MTREQAFAFSLDRHGAARPPRAVLHLPARRERLGLPWNLDCEDCDKFLMSGADLLYWRREQEQLRAIAERALDDVTADYLHKVFEPTYGRHMRPVPASSFPARRPPAVGTQLRADCSQDQRIWTPAPRYLPG